MADFWEITIEESSVGRSLENVRYMSSKITHSLSKITYSLDVNEHNIRILNSEKRFAMLCRSSTRARTDLMTPKQLELL